MPIRPKRILWPTDFSELSLHGGRYARELRKLFNSELHIIHVLAAPMSAEIAVTLPAEVPVTLPEPELIEAAKAGLRRLIADHFDGDSTIKSDAFFGGASTSVAEYAKRENIDLIVVSTHGRTGLQHVLIGSTAEQIVRYAPCPVLTVKNPATDFLED